MNKYNTLFNLNYKKIFGIFIQNVKKISNSYYSFKKWSNNF